MAKASVLVMRCEVCGRNDRGLTISSQFTGPVVAVVRCELCQGLIDANLIRPELVDGELRYRGWHVEWTPGDLIPLPPDVPA